MTSRPSPAFPAYHRTPLWERALTVRQAYWLGCVRAACASVKAETGHDLPASLHRVLKVDATKHGGMPSASPSTVLATMMALAERRWIEPCLLPPELAPRDQRQSLKAFRLADRSALCNDAAELEKLKAEREELEMKRKRLARADPFSRKWQEEVEMAQVKGAIIAIEKRMAALREHIARSERETPAYEPEIPAEYLPIPQLLKACEPRTARAATRNPYME